MNPEVIGLTTDPESAAVASIEEAGKKIQEIMASAPVVDMARFTENMETIQRQTAANAAKMRRNLKDSLERAGFHPVFSSNN